jgi:acetyl-CoA carboxylase biotin carboxyl carrier protein
MSDSPSNWGEIFDVKKIRRLADLMNDQGLTEIELRHAETRIRLSRGYAGTVTVDRAAPPALPAAASAAAPAAAGKAEPASDANLHIVKSPMVGTYYASSSPESPAYVKVGDHVSKETIVCLIEAMKVFNEIPAEVAGKVVAVLVENGEPVEYGQPLFRVDTRG